MEYENRLDMVDFLWNDVACLQDENGMFLVVKALFSLPKDKEDILRLGDAIIQDVRAEAQFEGDRTKLNGQIAVVLHYECVEGNSDALVVAVPFVAEYQGYLQEGASLQQKYVFAEETEARQIRLEAVVAVPMEEKMERSGKVRKHFEREEVLELPAEWPKADEIIGTRLKYVLIEEADGKIGGKCYTGVIFADKDSCGEKIAYYEKESPFEITGADVDAEEIKYYSLSAQVIDERKILVRSNNMVYGREKKDFS